ncbi:family 43 glycosylhydrolase, partial [Actinosynnema sp. NPDC023658]|uniref:family 43 glycosylhydrolase n=1 Tax=Actinosynnema sp. NPDC023658 TaxID=3155465 RepID=UPI0033E64C57
MPLLFANPRTPARRALSLVVVAIAALSPAVVSQGRAEAAPGSSFSNPVVPAPNSADPTLVQHNGNYYYVATTATSDVLMRRSSTIAGLRSAPEQLVFRSDGTTMWAPHLEQVGDRWYLYFSVELSGAPRRTHVRESAGSEAMGPNTDRGIQVL